MNDQKQTRREQVANGVRRHRQKHDRVEVYLPRGWRKLLRATNRAAGLTTSQWLRKVVAKRIDREVI